LRIAVKVLAPHIELRVREGLVLRVAVKVLALKDGPTGSVKRSDGEVCRF